MIRGLLTATGKPIGPFGRLMAGVVMVAFIALSLKCFAIAPLQGHDHWHGGEKEHHQSDADHDQQHNDNSSDCCSILISMVSNSPQSIQKDVMPLPSSTLIVAIIPVSTVALAATETFFDYDPPDELSPAFLPTSSLSMRAPPMSV
ncbi:MAG: hypothetical protein HY864_00065 [Chloroflexi bacterium]|nr:hypothetical protein [Chloroflexota bacterium]